MGTPNEFLAYSLTVNGVGMILGFVSSTLIPLFWSGWADWDKDKKSKTMIALNFLVPLFAAFALGTWNRESFWSALVVGFQSAFTAYGTNQGTYKALRVGKKRST